MTTKTPQNMDDLFEAIFGYRPPKRGKGYELLVAAGLKNVMQAAQIRSDQFVRGTYSQEKYQLDALISGINDIFVEAKDYTEQSKKVGRDDITKLAGALQDLPTDQGILVSATGFTRHTKKYADATKVNPTAKPIELYHIRQSTEQDEQGRIKQININMHVYLADYMRATWTPVFTPDGNKILCDLLGEGSVLTVKTHSFVRADRSIVMTIFDLTSSIGVTDWASKVSIGEWKPTEAAFMEIEGRLIPLHSLKYSIPHNVVEHIIRIEANGTACLLVESADGSVSKLLTDVDLRKTKFGENGEVDLPG